MRVVLRGQQAIDILDSRGEPLPTEAVLEGGAVTTEPKRPRFDPVACGSLEEALFAAVGILLERHYARTGAIPTRKVISAARQVFEVLAERGDLPDSGSADTTFLAKLLAALKQITDDSGKPFFTDLIGFPCYRAGYLTMRRTAFMRRLGARRGSVYPGARPPQGSPRCARRCAPLTLPALQRASASRRRADGCLRRGSGLRMAPHADQASVAWSVSPRLSVKRRGTLIQPAQ